jgi:GntR family transcriptional regulator/MocR family aminotransferase
VGQFVLRLGYIPSVDLHVSLVGRTDLSGEIYRQLRQAILDGRLRPRDRLPPTRELARSLSVSRTTVSVAYERLSGQGFVTSRIGAGTFVAEHISISRQLKRQHRVVSPLRARPIWESIPVSSAFSRPAGFDFRSGIPDASLFPFDTWRRLMAGELRAAVVGTGAYAPPAGHLGLREAIARHIGMARAIQAPTTDITVTNGTQQALDVVARALLKPGDHVAVEHPGYAPPSWLFQSLGAIVQSVPVDREGLVVDDLHQRTRLVYVTPSHQYPLGVSMSLARRQALLAWAQRHDAAIVEDDYDSEFRFYGRPIEPLKALDVSGRVVYVSSFSKTMLPILRLGFVLTPPTVTEAVRTAKFVTDWHSEIPAQGALARFIDEGEFARHTRRMRAVYQERHELVTEILARDFAEHLELIPSDAGLHVAALARTASPERIHAIAARASEDGVEIGELGSFRLDSEPATGLVLGYGGIATSRITAGLGRLRACFDASGSATGRQPS